MTFVHVLLLYAIRCLGTAPFGPTPSGRDIANNNNCAASKKTGPMLTDLYRELTYFILHCQRARALLTADKPGGRRVNKQQSGGHDEGLAFLGHSFITENSIRNKYN